jgi:hypothetical protein
MSLIFLIFEYKLKNFVILYLLTKLINGFSAIKTINLYNKVIINIK